jgi:hypothetical protein
MSEVTLDAIGLRFGTDKSSRHHDYLNFYEQQFARRRQEPLTLLEVGVFNGASVRTWREYFPNAKIVGADIEPMAKRWRGERIEIEYMDQSNLEDLNRVAIKHGPFDIVIEDGSHLWEHQITTLKTLYPHVRPGGLYVVEDLQTNFGEMQADYRGVATQTCVQFLKTWLDYHIADTLLPLQGLEDPFLRTYGRGALTMNFYKRVCLIEKRALPLPAAAQPSRPLAPRPPGLDYAAIGLVAHVSHVGDVFGPDGHVDLNQERFTYQGMALDDFDQLLEYRVRGADLEWGPWLIAPEFAGTRGRALMLTGASVRLRDAAKGRYSLQTLGRFVGSPSLVVVSDDEDCISPTGTELRGLQIVLVRLSETSDPAVDAPAKL